ncbi:uncharacterized protein [Euwallacea fornicatus]|uniref:uncharacterized protein isoform X2 n=1 Tax=Euwallacea fornicatus TaxID=995702 RepID=UPI00338DC9C3
MMYCVLLSSLAIAAAQYQPQYQQAQQVQYQQAQYQQPQYQRQPQYQNPQYQQHLQQQQQQQHEGLVSPAQYPAGVDASSCPNYPDCSNPLVTLQAVAKASDPRYLAENTPSAPPKAESQYSPEIQQKLDRGEYIGDGDYHGEGLDEALAPQVATAVQYTTASRSQYNSPQPQYTSQPGAGAVQYPAQQAASQYSAQPGAVQYTAPRAATQYATQPATGAVQYPAQRAASQYAVQPAGVQYQARQIASQYVTTPQYITASQGSAAGQYYQRGQSAQSTLFTPQYVRAETPVHETRAYSPVANVIAAGSEPVAAVQLPAGVDVNVCTNYPFCHS